MFEPNEVRDLDTASSVGHGSEGGVIGHPSQPAGPESAVLGLPFWIWRTMMVCYGLFFGGLFLAVGRDAEAVFMLVVSAGYAVMYFGTSWVLMAQGPKPPLSPFQRGHGDLQTFTGPMSIGAVAAQVLTVPACLAFFGLAMAALRAFGG